jgi:hypothetical protein
MAMLAGLLVEPLIAICERITKNCGDEQKARDQAPNKHAVRGFGYDWFRLFAM